MSMQCQNLRSNIGDSTSNSKLNKDEVVETEEEIIQRSDLREEDQKLIDQKLPSRKGGSLVLDQDEQCLDVELYVHRNIS